MEVYILDSLLRREQVIDKFQSCIWTERWAEIGDFELILSSTLASRTQLTTGTQLAMNNSYRVMTVETVEDTTDEEGKAVLKAKGRSLEKVLEDRVGRDNLAVQASDAKWTITGTPGNIARQLFTSICVQGLLDPRDVIPFITPGTLFQTNTIPEPSDVITRELQPGELYGLIKAICDEYELGFRLVRNFDTSQLYFDIYTGNDRTTSQTVFPPVIFSPGLDNLQNTTELATIEKSKNVAYVFSSQGTQVVYADGVDPDIDGFERRVMSVQADDLQVEEGQTVNPADVAAHLIKKGKEELAKVRAHRYFDGEISQYAAYKYGVHYNLGDMVEKRSADGVISKPRVTEQIFVCDEEGERSYPTFSEPTYDAINTWAYQGDREWIDFDETEFWANQD
jgi:hypothetical protein